VLALLATVATAWLAQPVPAAAARRVDRAYEGTTSAGGTIRLFTSARDGVVRFQGLGLEDAASCDDGTSISFGHGFDLSPRGPLVTESALHVEQTGFSDAFFLEGTLGSKAGSGTVTHLFAALDATEEPQICTTGELTWSVERVPLSALGRAGTELTTTLDGVEETLAIPGSADTIRLGDDARAREHLRSYEGRTSARQPLSFVTSRRPQGIVLLDMGVAWDLACDDGTAFGLGFFILFAGEPLEPGRVDYDVAEPGLAFHVNGTLGAHLGSGTTSSVLPALTADLQAQTCRSGDLTWQAWRIDAGARPIG
jgi:hypothetical protein